MLLLYSRHIPRLGSPHMFSGYRRAQPCGTLILKCPAVSLASFLPLWSHPIHPEFVSGWVVSRGVWGKTAAGLAESLQSQAGWDPPKTDQFWGCRTSICILGACLMLMVLDLNLFSSFCLSSTDLAEIAKKGMWDTSIAHWKHWLAQQLCNVFWGQFFSLE